MNIYKSQKHYDQFSQKMAELFDTDYQPQSMPSESIIPFNNGPIGEFNAFYGLNHTKETKDNHSKIMKTMRSDKNSIFNTIEYIEKQTKALKDSWKNIESGFHKIDRKKQSENMKQLRNDKSSVYNSEKYLKLVGEKSKERFKNLKFKSIYEKTYIVTNQSNEIFEINGLAQFCRDNNLTYSCMKNILNGTQNYHKGWTIKRKD